MADKKAIIQLFHTSGTNKPDIDLLSDGEIAIGMNPEFNRIWFKNTDNTLTEFLPKDYIEANYYSKEEVDSIFNEDMKRSLWNLLKICAYSTDEIDDILTEFKDTWGIDITYDKVLTGITAVYDGGEVYAGRAVTALTGLTVIANYDDGYTEEVTGFTLSNDNDKIIIGNNVITVTYKGQTTTFNVKGKPGTIEMSYITAAYDGGDVPIGTEIDELSGISVNAVYNDGTSLEVFDYELSGSTITEGSNVISVFYSAFTATFTVTGVGERVVTGITATYNGDSVSAGTIPSSLTNVTVTAYYNDKTSEEVTDYTLNGTIIVGASTIYVKYDNYVTTITVTGVESNLVYSALTDSFITTNDSPTVKSIGDLNIDDTHYIETNIDISQCGQIAGYSCFSIGISSTLDAWSPGNLYTFPIAASSVVRFQAVYASGSVNSDVPWSIDLNTVNIKIKTSGLYINNKLYTNFTNNTNWTTFLTKFNTASNIYIGAGYLNSITNDYPVINYKSVYYVTDNS